jgi:hypothetical protein
MKTTFAVLALMFATTAVASPPETFRPSEVQITLERAPRWPTGELVVLKINSSRVRVERTALPCKKCEPRVSEAPFSETRLVELLNSALKSDFFGMLESYTEVPTYFQVPGGEVKLGSVITTDEDIGTITVTIGEWSHKVVDEGEAPCGFKQFAEAIENVAKSAVRQ